MSWLDRFKPHKGGVYRTGQTLPEPDYETATGRKLYTVQQMRAAYSAGVADELAWCIQVAANLPGFRQNERAHLVAALRGDLS